jgi:hypothetical protein
MIRYRHLSPLAALAVVAATLASPAAAADRAAFATDLMEEARAQASDLQNTAARLEALGRSKHSGPMSHTWALNDICDDVNELGSILSILEQVRPETTGRQQQAIADARPRIEALAARTTRAIELRQANSANRLFPEYRGAIRSIYENAAELDRMLGTVIDDKRASARIAAVPPAVVGVVAR